MINKLWKNQLFDVIGNLINESNAKTIIVNGIEDHVHCFFALKPVMSVAELMKTVKAKSSKYVNDNNLTPHRFEWQEGMVCSLIVNVMWILFIITLRIRKNIIRSNLSMKSIKRL